MKLATSFLGVLAGMLALHAADHPGASKTNAITLTTNSSSVTISYVVLKHPVEDVRAALDVFMSQSRTNNRHGWFTASGVQAESSGGEKEFKLTVCSCDTPAPCYRIKAVRRSALETRLSVHALDSNSGDQVHQFRSKRDQRIVDDLTAILAANR